jgi:hypothetical protein
VKYGGFPVKKRGGGLRDGWPGRDKMSERRIDRNIYKYNAVFGE